MNFAHTPAAAQGTIAPEGGCPGNFFTSRKWTFEHGALIIRDHKSEVLAELCLRQRPLRRPPNRRRRGLAGTLIFG